jgi:hypothetical protein
MSEFLELKSDSNGNDMYILHEGAELYRADDNKDFEKKPRFFGLTSSDVQSYGKIIYKFIVKRQLKLLALDKNFKPFYSESNKEVQKILIDNYGYYSKKRDSISVKDNILVDYICSNGYDGYAIDYMEKKDMLDGKFPREIVICNYDDNIKSREMVSKLTSTQINEAHNNAKLKKIEKEEKINRKKRDTVRYESPPSSPFKGMRIFNDDVYNTPPPPPTNRALFGGRRRSKKIRKTRKTIKLKPNGKRSKKIRKIRKTRKKM